jgi:hypothetical protein
MSERLNKNRRDFMKAASFLAGSAFLTGCKVDQYVVPSSDLLTPHSSPTLNLIPKVSKTPFQPETPTHAPTETLHSESVEDLFKLGSFDVGRQPFEMETTPQLMLGIGYSKPDTRIYSANFPLPIAVPAFGSEEQRATFDNAAKNNSDGNPYYVILTEKPNHLFLAFHSFQTTPPGDLAREIGAVAFNHPDRFETDILGQKVIITPKGSSPIEAEIVYASPPIPGEVFDNGTDGVFPWGYKPVFDNPLIAFTSKFGIPEPISNGNTSETYFLTIIGCQNSIPGEISDLLVQNSANRTLLTLKFTLPK